MLTKQTVLVTALTALFGGIAAADTNVQSIVLDGHADPTGSSAYNVGLSLRRAEAVRDQLVKLGVESSRIVIASFGEDAPLGGSYAEERRVSLSLSNDSVASLIDQAFERNGTSVTWEKPITTAQLDEPVTETVASR